MRMGIQRVLEASEGGRGFLQEHGLRFENPPGYNNYFASLRSERRRDLAREVNLNLITRVEAKVCDRQADIPELALYACFAVDGHWHKGGAWLVPDYLSGRRHWKCLRTRLKNRKGRGIFWESQLLQKEKCINSLK